MSSDKPRLIEVAFPLKATSLDSVHEKNVRHGHISTLHIWPARRPLAASTARPTPSTTQRRVGGSIDSRNRRTHWTLKDGPKLQKFLEAPPRFELGIKVLQTSALPLGHGARRGRL